MLTFSERLQRWLPARQRVAEGLDAKASRTGPLIAYGQLGQAVWSPRDYNAFAREGFMANAICYRSVRMIAEAAASIPWLLYEGGLEIEDHPLLDLMRRPSLDHTGTDFLESWYGFLLVAGNAYVEAVALGENVRELHALRPDRMKVIAGPNGWPEGYEYTVAGQSVRFMDDVVTGVRPILHVRMFHPVNDHYGMSPIEAASVAIDIHNTASNWNKALLDNSARPSGALVYAANNGQMNAEQFERLKVELETSVQGAAHAGRPLLLEGGLDWKPLSLTPKDMDFIEAKNSAAREIALALGVPPMLLGIPGDNTFTDDPYDRAGPTNRGITLEDYAHWKNLSIDATSRGQLVEALKQIPDDTVTAIYLGRYWRPAGCAELPAVLALMHFDAAVNHGVGTAIRMLQQAAGADADGEIGALTRAAIAAHSVREILTRYAELRRTRYRGLSTFWRFGRGWLGRVDATEALAKSLVSETALSHDREGKTDMDHGFNFPLPGQTSSSASTPPVAGTMPAGKWWPQSKTVWGTLITALTTVLPLVGPLIGINIPVDVIKVLGDQSLVVIQALGGLIGTLLALYGRANAVLPLVRRDVSVTV